MNVKTARYIRKLLDFSPNEEREYKNLQTLDYHGRPIEIETTQVATGKRADYQLLKKYFKGEDVILPHHLRELVNNG